MSKIEKYPLDKVWAVFGGCEGDDPFFVALFDSENVANSFVTASSDANSDMYIVDCQVLPGFVQRGELYIANNVFVTTHEELLVHAEKALAGLDETT